VLKVPGCQHFDPHPEEDRQVRLEGWAAKTEFAGLSQLAASLEGAPASPALLLLILSDLSRLPKILHCIKSSFIRKNPYFLQKVIVPLHGSCCTANKGRLWPETAKFAVRAE
jgi:hypothetical protein